MTDDRSVDRYFTNALTYILPADDQERVRLLKQHQALTRVFGNRPILAPVHFTKGDQILEIGAAAGAWLHDAAQQIGLDPGVKFHAIDIEDRLFPSKPPPNMSFSVASVLELPPKWNGRFSYVHQRLLIAALTEAQWPTAIREIYRVLKPGGWVELSEGEAHLGCPEGHSRHRAYEVLDGVLAAKGFMVDVGIELQNLLKEAGFVDIKMVPRRVPLGRWGGELDGLDGMIGFFRAVKKPVLMEGGFGIVKTGEEYDALIDDLEREWNELPGHTWGHWITYARKPE